MTVHTRLYETDRDAFRRFNPPPPSPDVSKAENLGKDLHYFPKAQPQGFSESAADLLFSKTKNNISIEKINK